MNIITRWSPTLNGSLHLGHIYSLLVNEHFAHDRDGKFIVRFDDESPPVLALPKHTQQALLESQWADIEWLDIKVDMWQIQSKIHEAVLAGLDAVGHKTMKDVEEGYHVLPTSVRMLGTNWLPYPYVPQQTAERVVMDHMIGATHLIRGEEFFGEFSLYSYFCEKFNFPIPIFIFLPRLVSRSGDISKHSGGYTIAEYRARGYTANNIKELIAEAVLYWAGNGWDLHNLRPNPQINV